VDALGDRRRRRGIDVNDVVDVVGVAAGEHDADRGAGRHQAVEREFVAHAQAGPNLCRGSSVKRWRW
jgi:hypothetical protein